MHLFQQAIILVGTLSYVAAMFGDDAYYRAKLDEQDIPGISKPIKKIDNNKVLEDVNQYFEKYLAHITGGSQEPHADRLGDVKFYYQIMATFDKDGRIKEYVVTNVVFNGIKYCDFENSTKLTRDTTAEKAKGEGNANLMAAHIVQTFFEKYDFPKESLLDSTAIFYDSHPWVSTEDEYIRFHVAVILTKEGSWMVGNTKVIAESEIGRVIPVSTTVAEWTAKLMKGTLDWGNFVLDYFSSFSVAANKAKDFAITNLGKIQNSVPSLEDGKNYWTSLTKKFRPTQP